MKNTATSYSLPPLAKTTSLAKTPSNLFKKPTLNRIFYSPLPNKQTKENYNCVMLQSCVGNKRYDDLLDQNNEKKIRVGLQPSEDGSRKVLELPPTCVGKQAPIVYYNQYKTLERTLLKKDLNNSAPLPDFALQNPVVSLLEKADALQVLPLCLGLVKSKGEANILNVKDYNLGDRYIIAMAAGLKKARSVEKMYLNGNRITDLSLCELAGSISQEVTVLQLSRNKITTISKKLLQIIIESQYRLQHLGLASNMIKEVSAQAVFRNARYSKHLKRLDLRNNRLGNGCLQTLAELIQKTLSLEQLYIGTNYLYGKCGQRLFNVLAHNKTIRVFDYSLNQLGDEGGVTVAQAIGTCLRSNRIIQHLDLSFNNFGKQASQLISAELQPNKTLIGFHFRGNYGFINSRGFLVLAERQGTLLHSVDTFQIDSFQITAPRQHNSMGSHLYRNVCWICQGWYEQEFKFSHPKIQGKILIYIHFDFQKYEPRLISLTQQVRYVTMVPPRKYRYFFTVNNQIYLDPHVTKQTLPFPETLTYEMDHAQRTFRVQTVNQLSGKTKKVTNQWNQLIIKTPPRWNGLINKKEKEPWNYSRSVWAKEYKLQDEEMLRKCFEKDWKCSKLTNLVKNQGDQDKVKQTLWNAYAAIKNLYKQFSSWSPFGDVWAVSSQPFTDFCQQSRILSKDMPLKIIDLTFITTNSMSSADWKGNTLVPQRGLVRFQFMESLVRLSQQKYKKLGIYDNFSDSTSQIIKQHVLPLSCTYNPHQWRNQKYFNQFNDALIKKYRPLFSAIYKKNSRLKVRPGEKPFMCLAQFKGIFQRIGLSTTITERDTFLAFNNAMMTQVDQMENQRFMRMTEIQFIEGIARCAFCLSNDYVVKPSDFTLKAGEAAPLHFKLEWMAQQLRSLCPQQVRAQFPDIEETMFRQEEE